MTGWTDAEEEAVRVALTGMAWDLRFTIAAARQLLRGPLDAETAEQLTRALDTMMSLRGQLEVLAGAAHEIAGRG